ncbi:MAG: hypothetical protein DRI39_02905 [Chloroflexi bacterium]|nr:MAG: hypothetical protein DRI39_02905 [Chloroflexota bacterium]
MELDPVARTDESLERRQCCHHWVIQPPKDFVSRGVCKICGEVRQFKNELDPSCYNERTWPARKATGLGNARFLAKAVRLKKMDFA